MGVEKRQVCGISAPGGDGLEGRVGHDTLYGGQNNDTLYGGLGNEAIKTRKRFAPKENLMDRMNATELAANQSA